MHQNEKWKSPRSGHAVYELQRNGWRKNTIPRPAFSELDPAHGLACGAMVANLYYAQTLIEAVGPEIGLSKALAGAIVTLTQLGYGIGLFAIVPLGDLLKTDASH